MRRILLSICLLGALAACGEDEGDADTPADAAATSPDAESLVCDREGFATETHQAERDDELGLLFYTGERGVAPEVENLTIDLYFALGAADEVHDFSLTGESLADCHTCVLVRSGCGESNCSSGKTFLAQSGTLSITDIGDIGTQLQGSLQSARFAEVTIDPADLETTVVPDGATWCLDNYEFIAAVTGPL